MPPRRGALCTVCMHPMVADIDRLLVSGMSPYQVEKRYPVHRDALWRHKKNGHMPGSIDVLEGEVLDAPDKGQALLDRVEAQIARVERVAAASEKQGNTRAILDATREMRGLLELLGKVSGELRDSPQVAVNLIASPDWIALRTAVLSALAEYPEARQAVTERLLTIEGGRT